MQIVHTTLTFVVLLSLSWLISEKRKQVNIKLIALGVFWQVIFALVLLKVPAVTDGLMYINRGLQVIAESTTKATAVVFGNLAAPSESSKIGFILALQGLPILIVISALSSLLIYLRILPTIINLLSIFFRKTLSIGGTMGVAVSANIFTGMSETPLIITPYLSHLTRSELFSLMVCGTSCIASSVMVLLSMIIQPIVPNAIVHIISAVLLSIPGALTVSRIMVPESQKSSYTEGTHADFSECNSMIDAIFSGIISGAKVVVVIVAMLIGFVALIDVLNQLLGLLPDVGGMPISLQRILGLIMWPISWLIGIPMKEAGIVSTLLGTKIAFNEIIAFQEMANIGANLSEHTKIMTIYAICSFANLGSIGIMVGVYEALVPHRRAEVMSLGVKSVIAGTITNLLNASLVGAFLLC